MAEHNSKARPQPAFLFDLDGTLIDSVYQHVLAWREALEAEDIHLPNWYIHRRIGMSGGLIVHAFFREAGRQLDSKEIARLQKLHSEAFKKRVDTVHVLPGARICCKRFRDWACPGQSPPVAAARERNSR